MGVPPERAIFVFEVGLAGEEVREGWLEVGRETGREGGREVVRTLRRSEMREPAAEGGFLARWTKVGVEDKERVDERGVDVSVEFEVRDDWLLGM